MKIFTPVIIFLLAMVGVGSYLGLFIAPPDKLQSDAQRIMYIHVPSAWVGLSFMIISGFFSLVYVLKRRNWADYLAWSFAKVGSVFAALALITGSIWGRPIWGVWWVWEARLTTTLILFLIYVAYLMLGIDKNTREKTKRLRAVFAIVGSANVPLVWFSVKIWRTLHQQYSVIGVEGKPSIAPEMLKVLLFNIFVVFIFAIFVAFFDGVKSYSKNLSQVRQQVI
ncbi:MAG: cytochrome c biogenesis protein CcsA [Candidatus Calescibacterium sp.]|jgi:heme exporter protein C